MLPAKRNLSGVARVASGFAVAAVLVSIGCANLPGSHRFGHPVHVSEVVALSQHGVPPDEIIAKMNRGGLVYYLSEVQYTEIRSRGVTPQVIEYMKVTYVQAVAEHPKLAADASMSCFYLGPDGHWYAGGPEGFHPDC
jgi:hypothetical protein